MRFNKQRDGGRKMITFVTLTANVFLSCQQPSEGNCITECLGAGVLALLTLPLENNKYAELSLTTKEI